MSVIDDLYSDYMDSPYLDEQIEQEDERIFEKSIQDGVKYEPYNERKVREWGYFN